MSSRSHVRCHNRDGAATLHPSTSIHASSSCPVDYLPTMPQDRGVATYISCKATVRASSRVRAAKPARPARCSALLSIVSLCRTLRSVRLLCQCDAADRSLRRRGSWSVAFLFRCGMRNQVVIFRQAVQIHHRTTVASMASAVVMLVLCI